MSDYTRIDQLDLYRTFEAAADWGWDCLDTMKPIHVWTFGKQMVDAADSVCANLIEGGHRYGDADQIKFFVIALASAEEFIYWIRRAARQQAIPKEQADAKVAEVQSACKQLNSLISYRRSKPYKTREVLAHYAAAAEEGRQIED